MEFIVRTLSVACLRGWTLTIRRQKWFKIRKTRNEEIDLWIWLEGLTCRIRRRFRSAVKKKRARFSPFIMQLSLMLSFNYTAMYLRNILQDFQQLRKCKIKLMLSRGLLQVLTITDLLSNSSVGMRTRTLLYSLCSTSWISLFLWIIWSVSAFQRVINWLSMITIVIKTLQTSSALTNACSDHSELTLSIKPQVSGGGSDGTVAGSVLSNRRPHLRVDVVEQVLVRLGQCGSAATGVHHAARLVGTLLVLGQHVV